MSKRFEKKCFSKTLQLGNFVESTNAGSYGVVTPATLSGIYQFEATGTASNLVLDEDGRPSIIPIILTDDWLLKIFKMSEVSTPELDESPVEGFSLFLSKNEKYCLAKVKNRKGYSVFFITEKSDRSEILPSEGKCIEYVHELQNFHSVFTGEYIDSSTIKKEKMDKFYKKTDFNLVDEVDLYDVYDFHSLFELFKQ